jgi:hypothetical protein
MGAWSYAAPRANGKISGREDGGHCPPLHAKFPTERRVTLVYVRGEEAWTAGTQEPVKDERCRQGGGAFCPAANEKERSAGAAFPKGTR